MLCISLTFIPFISNKILQNLNFINMFAPKLKSWQPKRHYFALQMCQRVAVSQNLVFLSSGKKSFKIGVVISYCFYQIFGLPSLNHVNWQPQKTLLCRCVKEWQFLKNLFFFLVVPQPVYMNMNDLNALAAQKAASSAETAQGNLLKGID